MAKRVRNYLKHVDGTPWPYGVVLCSAVDRIGEASKSGVGLYLTAEEIRSLEWCVIREEGGVANTDFFREGAFSEIGVPSDD